MLRARRRGLFRRDYEIESDHGPLTTLAGARREGCAFTLDGTEYRVERDGRRRFLLHGPDGRVATADRETRREWRVHAAEGNLKLVKPSMWRSGWEVHHHGSARGTIRHEGAFRRAFVADVAPDPVGVFALYVVLVSYERDSNAAAAAASS